MGVSGAEMSLVCWSSGWPRGMMSGRGVAFVGASAFEGREVGGDEIFWMLESRVMSGPMEAASGMPFGVMVRKGGDSNGAGGKGGSLGAGLMGLGDVAGLCAIDDVKDEKPRVEIVP